MDSLKIKHNSRLNFTWDCREGNPPGFIEVVRVLWDGGRNLEVGVPSYIETPVCEETIQTICECVRRTLSNTPHGNNA